MAQNSEWETIIKFDLGNENRQSPYPLEEYDTFTHIKEALANFELEFKGNYDELRFEYRTTFHGYGAQTNWYELQGRYKDPTKIVLYGKVKSNG